MLAEHSEVWKQVIKDHSKQMSMYQVSYISKSCTRYIRGLEALQQLVKLPEDATISCGAPDERGPKLYVQAPECKN